MAERLVSTYMAEGDGPVPPEQVSFRRGRPAVENLQVRLVQRAGTAGTSQNREADR